MKEAPKFPVLAVPAEPKLPLSKDVDLYASYIADRYGVPKLTVVISMAAAMCSFRSCGIRIHWQDDLHFPALRIFLLNGLSAPSFSWLDNFAAPLERLAKRPVTYSDEQLHRLASDYDGLLRTIAQAQEGSAVAEFAIAQSQKYWDELHPVRYHGIPPKPEAENFNFGSCPLLLRKDDLAINAANKIPDGSYWLALFRGIAAGAGVLAPYSFLLAADREQVGKYGQNVFSEHEYPLVLPQGGGALREPRVTSSEAMDAWDRLMTETSRLSEEPMRILTVSEQGAATLTRLKQFTESLRAAHLAPARYSWVLPCCLTLAAWIHLEQSAENEIGIQPWESALELTKWAVLTHGACLRICSGTHYHPPAVEDMERLRNRLRVDPSITYRELVRALPKRASGYWRGLHNCLANPSVLLGGKIIENARFNGPVPSRAGGPTRPTDPTTDRIMKSLERAAARNAAMNRSPFTSTMYKSPFT